MSTTFHFQFAELSGQALTSELRNAATNALVNTNSDEATDVDGWFTFVVEEEVPAGFYRIDAIDNGVQQGSEFVLVDGDATEFWANNYLANINRPLSTLATTAGVAASQSVITDAIGNLHDFDPASDTVSHVTLVDTCTTNADMRGTNNAVTSLAGVAQESTLISGVNAILEDTGTTLPGLIGALHNLDSTTVQSAATAALAAYDPPTRAEATADKEDVMAAVGTPLQADDYTAAPSAGDIAAAVWSAATRTLSAFGFDVEASVDAEALQDAIAETVAAALTDYGALRPTTAGRTLDVNSDGSIEASVDATVYVQPLSAGQIQRVKGTNITIDINDTSPIDIHAVVDDTGTSINLNSQRPLRIVIEREDGVNIQEIPDEQIDVIDPNEDGFRFIPNAEVVGTATSLDTPMRWALRKTINNKTLAKGLFKVEVAAD